MCACAGSVWCPVKCTEIQHQGFGLVGLCICASILDFLNLNVNEICTQLPDQLLEKLHASSGRTHLH